MPQLSLYLTQEQLARVETETHSEKMSLSKWVVTKILDKVEPRYPDGWADLFGSVHDETFIRPEQPIIEHRDKF